MKALQLLTMVAVVVGVPAAARAQSEDAGRAAQEDGCEPDGTLLFSLGTARLDLGAESDLSVAANWMWAEPGRSLMVAAPNGPLPADARLGYVRSMEAARYLTNMGVNPRLISVATYEESLTPSEQTAIGDVDSVVILSCVPVPPMLLPDTVLPPS